MSKVYLIGAGPGDLGLFTLKGKYILETSDVIIYDYLANADLLDFCREDAEILYVGKKGGDHSMPQSEINALIIAKAREGKSVARLKGGDPYIFGRGGEEAENLVEAGIPFEVVPGVTSGVAAAAYAGIPVTHRDYTTSVCFITGHENPTKDQSDHNWAVYGQSNSTLVFYMGVKNLPMIAYNLMRNGRSPETPVALVRCGTRCDQQSFVSSLRDVVIEAEARGFQAPSIIIVGGVCLLHDKLSWFEHKPLLGKGVVVTRSREQISNLSAILKDNGACVLEIPTISVGPTNDNKAVEEAILSLTTYDWVVFTSVNGVKYFWEHLDVFGLDARNFAGVEIAAIGSATAVALVEKGIKADFVPAKFMAEHLVSGLLDNKIAGKRVLIPRAREAREILPETLRKAGCYVKVLPVYETRSTQKDVLELHAALDNDKIHYVTFASSSTVDNFFSLMPADKMKKYKSVRFACIGPITANTLKKYGFNASIQPNNYTITALVSALTEDAAG